MYTMFVGKEAAGIICGTGCMYILLAIARSQVLSALRFFFEQQPQYDLAGEVMHTEHLLIQINNAKPDIVLLDWKLPGQPDAKLLTRCKALLDPPKVIALGD
ncbi:hypothetical protein KFU94_02020 [Chloroflexi bacterium TSY]|nr:hypothetical protein [Chloroflexi bacterium TSY]